MTCKLLFNFQLLPFACVAIACYHLARYIAVCTGHVWWLKAWAEICFCSTCPRLLAHLHFTEVDKCPGDEVMRSSQATSSQNRPEEANSAQVASETFRFASSSRVESQKKIRAPLSLPPGLSPLGFSPQETAQGTIGTLVVCPFRQTCQYCRCQCCRKEPDHESHRCKLHLNW